MVTLKEDVKSAAMTLLAMGEDVTDEGLVVSIFGKGVKFGPVSVDTAQNYAMNQDGSLCLRKKDGSFVGFDGESIVDVQGANHSTKTYVMALSPQSLKPGDVTIPMGSDHNPVFVTKVEGNMVTGISAMTGVVTTFATTKSVYGEFHYLPVMVNLVTGLKLAERMIKDTVFVLSALGVHDPSFRPFKVPIIAELMGLGDTGKYDLLIMTALSSNHENHLAMFMPQLLGLEGLGFGGGMGFGGMGRGMGLSSLRDDVKQTNEVADLQEKLAKIEAEQALLKELFMAANQEPRKAGRPKKV